MIDILGAWSARGQLGHQGMSGFVIGDDFFLARIDDARLALESGDHPIDGLVEVSRLDRATRVHLQDRRLASQEMRCRDDDVLTP